MTTAILRRIRALREARGILAKDVAREIGISRSFYTLIEGGKRRLTAECVSKIAKALSVPVSELYGEAPASRQDGSPLMPSPEGYQHLRPINTVDLRKRLKPLLGEQTEDAVDCLQMWFMAPKQVRKALLALCESDDEGHRRIA